MQSADLCGDGASKIKPHFHVDYLKPEARLNSIKISGHTAKEKRRLSITEINCLMLFREIIDVYPETHTEHTNTRCEKVRNY